MLSSQNFLLPVVHFFHYFLANFTIGADSFPDALKNKKKKVQRGAFVELRIRPWLLSVKTQL